ncbi:glycosyltransferase [Vibrio sp. TH_r3]|uniref:glycosyltransferase n=1 Tax=Vibrio sp. TH_r3 TaxID=3082084 RepID=UPI002952B422|nr:glycosyltransferase [Vibrio sp. TH_r3]MDV7104208.1 glycosyltransferase [Vibrio sp. TH_r3]
MKILQLSTYPIKEPRHGGQIRVYQIRKQLEKLGHDVISVSFSEVSHVHFDDEYDFIMDSHQLSQEISTPYATDLATALICEKSKKCQSFLVHHLKEHLPDYIFIEQPWLWPAVKRIKQKHPNLIKKIIYSSQNVEFETKKSLFSNNMIQDNDNVVDTIKSIEMDFINNADDVICCTNNDADIYFTLMNKNAHVCPNGVAPILNNDRVTAIRKSLRKKLGKRKKYALFVGSAYPPNAQGFWDNLSGSLSWLGMDEFIFSVGGCSNILDDFMPKEADIASYLNFDKVKRLGYVSNEELSALIYECTLIILPISDGGGSNLKTAEAIISNKPVVATEMSCRGFDNFDKYTNVFVCGNDTQFREKIKYCFENTLCTELNEEEKNSRARVYWTNTLKGIKNVVV